MEFLFFLICYLIVSTITILSLRWIIINFSRFKDWISELPGRIKRKIWNRGILDKYNKLYIRKDEFHKSLDLDVDAIYGRSKEEKQKYLNDLVRRRNIAHERDLD